MDWFLLVITWLHIIAAMFWIGGMLFLSLVLVPTLKAEANQITAHAFLRVAARRFRTIAWGAIVFLLFTGIILLFNRGFLTDSYENWPSILFIKLTLVGLLIVYSVIHDLVLGPRVGVLKQKPETSWTSAQKRLVVFSPWLARLAVLLALGVIFAATMLARY